MGRFPKISGPFGTNHDKDSSILGPMVGVPYLWKRHRSPYSTCPGDHQGTLAYFETLPSHHGSPLRLAYGAEVRGGGVNTGI